MRAATPSLRRQCHRAAPTCSVTRPINSQTRQKCSIDMISLPVGEGGIQDGSTWPKNFTGYPLNTDPM